VKVRIGGESFDFDEARRPMSEAIAVERAWGRRYAEWESELQAGSAEAMAVFVWLVWRRDGREVELADILSGEVDFDYRELEQSILEVAVERQKAAEAEANPTQGAVSPAAPDGTDTTSSGT
jgi:hypothetical protein